MRRYRPRFIFELYTLNPEKKIDEGSIKELCKKYYFNLCTAYMAYEKNRNLYGCYKLKRKVYPYEEKEVGKQAWKKLM